MKNFVNRVRASDQLLAALFLGACIVIAALIVSRPRVHVVTTPGTPVYVSTETRGGISAYIEGDVRADVSGSIETIQ